MEAKSGLILYIANRGEIARRVIRSARKLGFKTIVGYADQDKELPFVKEADQSFSLNGEESRDTYLNIDKIISISKKAGVTHLHPGYGFLSENPLFVDRLEKEGIQFVGPPSSAMRLLGDKIGSRKFLSELNVPLLPFYDGEDQSEKKLQNESLKLGFPILIKPSAGGGGKGMVKITKPEEFIEGLRSSKRIAQSAFSDARVFLERYIEKGRHIEVQVLRDTHGQVFILGERECTVQRSHQKVIEEAPCVFLPEKIRKTIFDSSRKMAEASGYLSAGTIEWIWDGADGIYFLEVNARLQVEHPVTELVWNLDLVEAQLKIALKEKLDIEITEPKGHAIEVRLCAEDPAEGFMPSGGIIHKLELPEGLRSDFGYREKNSVPSQFDSLMGKIISYGSDRNDAREKLLEGLKKLVVMGPTTNRAYLIQLLDNPKIKAGNLWTRMLEEISPVFNVSEGFKLLKEMHSETDDQPLEDDLDFYSPWGALKISKKCLQVEEYGEKKYFHSSFFDWSIRRQKKEGAQASASAEEMREMRSPLPARAIKIFVTAGAELKKGDLVMIVEAMKMEIKIKSPRAGRVKEVLVSEGERIPVDSLLMTWIEEGNQ